METAEKATLSGVSVLSGRPVEVSIADGTIQELRELPEGTDTGARFVSPGFFDMQVNGYLGSDYSLDEFSEEHMRAIHKHLAAAGTTQHIPTIVTSPQERLLRNLSIINEVAKRDAAMNAAIPGVHIEGPYVSSEDGPRGAHDPAYVRDPDYQEFREWQAAAGDRIVMVTVAPERRGAVRFIEKLTADGVCVAIGHSAAEPEEIRAAVAAGARCSTHLGNGSHAMIPRLKNYIWEQLAQDDLYAGIICDGHHLPEAVVKCFYRMKGLSRLILVSDAALLGGYSPGIYKWGNIDVEVFPDGHLGLPGTTMLAGAAHLLDWSIAHFHRFTGVPLSEVVRLCTRNPARLLGMESSTTTELSVGAAANVVEFEYSGADERLRITRTIAGGEESYKR